MNTNTQSGADPQRLNEAAANACGWHKRKDPETGRWYIIRPDGSIDPRFGHGPFGHSEEHADFWLAKPCFVGFYCQDINAAHQLLAVVEAKMVVRAFMHELMDCDAVNMFHVDDTFDRVVKATPLQITAAALKALGVYPEGEENVSG